jgi:hypothetical protein
MSATGEYRVHAATCVKLAQQTEDTASKLSLLDMARAWLALATQGDKNNEAQTLVYQTPEPRQQVAQQQHQTQPKKK